MLEPLTERLQRLFFGRKQQQAFLEDLLYLIQDGVLPSQAIDTIKHTSDGPLRQVAQDMLNGITQGQLLATGMAKWFDTSLVAIIRAGETSGAFKEALQACVTSFSERSSAIEMLIKSLTYPVLVFIIALVVVVFVKINVLNTFAEIKPVQQWPALGQELYGFGSVLQAAWWLFLIIMLLMLYSFILLLRYTTGNMRYWIDQIPLLSLYRDITAARFMETLGLLVANGTALKEALSTLHQGASPYLSWHLLQMEYRLSDGKENPADVLDTRLIQKKDLFRLKIVSTGKGFEHALVRLGRQASRRNDHTIMLTGRLLGAVFLFIVTIIAAMIVLGIYSIGSGLTTT